MLSITAITFAVVLPLCLTSFMEAPISRTKPNMITNVSISQI